MDAAQRQRVSRARSRGADAATQGLPFPGSEVGTPDYFSAEQFAMREGYSETVWARAAATGAYDLRAGSGADAKQNKPEKRPFKP